MPRGHICPETGAICVEIAAACRRRCSHPARLARDSVRRKRKPQRRVWDSARWQSVRAFMRARDGACVDCGATEKLSVHHIVALADGGAPFDAGNCITLCASCHRRREVARLRKAPD
jgi:5-methylcytosine-specific restriction endonuclease McrA